MEAWRNEILQQHTTFTPLWRHWHISALCFRSFCTRTVMIMSLHPPNMFPWGSEVAWGVWYSILQSTQNNDQGNKVNFNLNLNCFAFTITVFLMINAYLKVYIYNIYIYGQNYLRNMKSILLSCTFNNKILSREFLRELKMKHCTSSQRANIILDIITINNVYPNFIQDEWMPYVLLRTQPQSYNYCGK